LLGEKHVSNPSIVFLGSLFLSFYVINNNNNNFFGRLFLNSPQLDNFTIILSNSDESASLGWKALESHFYGSLNEFFLLQFITDELNTVQAKHLPLHFGS
jgi:hypothetical protein